MVVFTGNPNKILFLDIDGVVNSRNTTDFKNNLWPVDSYMAFLVGSIQLHTDCQVVLSSSWRHHPDGVAAASKIVPIYDTTPNMGDARGVEIDTWLSAHPNVTRYAIVDDDADMLPHQLPNFFQTTFDSGLTEDIAHAIITHLNA